MKRHRLITMATLLILVTSFILWRAFVLQEPMINGKPASYWASALATAEGPDWSQKWIPLGAQAEPVLLEALDKQQGPFGRGYAVLWTRLPTPVRNSVPQPLDYARMHSSAWYLLNILRTATNVPLSAVSSALKDQSSRVRLAAIDCLRHAILPSPGAKKDELLPLILGTVQDPDLEVRWRAVLSLAHYPERSTVVIPVLTNALVDVEPDVRIRAALALHQVDPAAAERAGVRAVAQDCLDRGGSSGPSLLADRLLKQLGIPQPTERQQ